MSFTAFPLHKLGLSPAHLQLCTKANYLNAQDVLLPPIPDLSRRLKIRLQEAQALVSAVSRAIVPRISLVSTLTSGEGSEPGTGLGKRKRKNGREMNDGDLIRTGDEALDGLLGGGIRTGCITEIVGESAAGKSHLTLHLSLCAQLPSLTSRPGGTIILTSERELATTRLSQLGETIRQLHAKDMFMKRDTLSDGVLTRRVADVEQLDDVLSYGVPALLERGRAGDPGKGSRLMGFRNDLEEDTGEKVQGGGKSKPNNMSTPSRPLIANLPRKNRAPGTPIAAIHHRPTPTPQPIRLIILDSLTALLRGAETSFTSTSAGLTARSKHLCSIGDKLKALAVEYELAVVVINQVSDVFDRRPYSKPPDGDDKPPPAPPPHPYTQSQHPSSSQSLNLTHDQAWYAAGPDPPLLYTTQGRWFSGQGSSGKKEAALGVVWANTVNTRIMLSRTGRRRVLKSDEMGYREDEIMSGRQGGDVSPGGIEGGERTLIRRAHLVFSPFAPPGTVDFVIRPSGISGLKGTYTLDENGAKVLARARKREKAIAGADEGEGNGEEDNGEAGGDMEEDLFGPLNGLDEVPEEWWNGIVNGEMLGEEPRVGAGESGVNQT